MAKYVALKNDYVVNVFIWDGGSGFAYPDESVDLLEINPAADIGIGDLYNGVLETFSRPTESPTDVNYPEELDYLWLPLGEETEEDTETYNWGIYIGDIGGDVEFEGTSQTDTIPQSCGIIIALKILTGSLNDLTVSSAWTEDTYSWNYDFTADIYRKGVRPYGLSESFNIYFGLDMTNPLEVNFTGELYIYKAHDGQTDVGLTPERLIGYSFIELYKAAD